MAAIYSAAKKKIDAREIPTLFIQAGQTLYRSINPNNSYTSLPMPKPGTHLSKAEANKLLIPGDGPKELDNRFSGPSYNGAIAPTAGLYCVLQQQALVNESRHYFGKAAAWALSGRCVLKIRLMGSILVADLSPHSPRARRFLRELGANTWDQMVDPKDCSVARGIGLAVAQTGFLRGLSVQTVRSSERSAEERGDNLVLFTSPGQPVLACTSRKLPIWKNLRARRIRSAISVIVRGSCNRVDDPDLGELVTPVAGALVPLCTRRAERFRL